MKAVVKYVQTYPAGISAAVLALVNLVAVFSGWNPTVDQLGAINVALAALLGLFTHASVTPTAKK